MLFHFISVDNFMKPTSLQHFLEPLPPVEYFSENHRPCNLPVNLLSQLLPVHWTNKQTHLHRGRWRWKLLDTGSLPELCAVVSHIQT